jgi:hypothetical protein
MKMLTPRGKRPASLRAGLPWTLALLVLSGSPGCSKAPTAPLPTTYPVTGKVIFEAGQPATGGSVQFRSTTDPSISALGEIGPDGSFSLNTRVDNYELPGTIEGPHEVTVIPAMSEDQMEIPVVLPDPYIVGPGDNDFTIEIAGPSS